MHGRETPEREDWVKHTSSMKLGYWGNRYFRHDSLLASFQIFGGVTLKGHNELGWHHRGNLLSLYIRMFKNELCVWDIIGGAKYISHSLWIPPPSLLHHSCGLIFCHSYSFWKICWFFLKNGNPSRINWDYFKSYFSILLVIYLYLNVLLAIILARYYSS